MKETALSFDQAREIAGAYAEVRFNGPGTFHVADYGLSDGETFAVVLTGAREWLVDQDWHFLVPDDEVLMVNLQTGDLIPLPYFDAEPLLDDLDRVGEWPDDD